MQNPASLVNDGQMQDEVRSIERVSQTTMPITVDGEIQLRSELMIDDRGYHLKQSVAKNTTPYKFAIGSAKNARLIQ
jgi:hypothetical protein